MASRNFNVILSPENLRFDIYERLICMLKENETWKILAEYFDIFSEREYHNLVNQEKAVERFLYELSMRLCTIEIFSEALRNCQLFNILMLFKEHCPLQIIEQTTVIGCSKAPLVTRGQEIKLSVSASGMPPPKYQWFYENLELEGKTDSFLIIKNFDLPLEGEYYCIISQEGYGFVQSNSLSLMLAPETPVIIKEPNSKTIAGLGTTVTLFLVAQGHPKLNYQWYKGNQELNACTNSTLTLEVSNTGQYGKYRCYVYNSAGEIWSREAEIATEAQSWPELSGKLALLISNQLYDNLSVLYKPEKDVKTLADLLKNLGFFVLALQNLNLAEMRNAIQFFANIVPANSYVVFYFAGHGFEIHDKFMLPVDTPGPDDYLQSDSICERELLKTILSSNPKVFLELLDMCLKPPNASNKKIFRETPDLYQYQADNNLIQGYSTTSYLGAYEKRTGENGLYVEHLKKYLIYDSDLPIVEILQKVAKDVASASPKQKPFFGTNVTMDYRLSDHCDPSPCLKKKLEKFALKSKESLLHFKKVNVKSIATFSPYLGIFLNTLEIRLSDLSDFRVTCEALGSELSFKLYRDKDHLIIKIMNLQRLKNDKTLSLILKKNEAEVDRGDVNIEKSSVTALDSW